jgi:hypothetical protein
VVVKTTNEDNLIADLAQTFANLRVYRWKLNPEKCVFGVPSSKLLGFMVSHHGIEANPAKVDVVRKMNRPTGNKDVMKLTGMMVALGRFISKLGEKGLPFFKLLKKFDKFKWTDEAYQALEELKTFLMTPQSCCPRHPRRPCFSTSPHPPRWSARCWWLSDMKRATSTPSSDLSTMSVRPYPTARSGTHNPRNCYMLS